MEILTTVGFFLMFVALTVLSVLVVGAIAHDLWADELGPWWRERKATKKREKIGLMAGRRVQSLTISYGAMAGMLMSRPMCEITTTMPADAQIINVEDVPSRGCLKLIIQSSAFPEVAEAAVIPEMHYTMTTSETPLSSLIRQFERMRREVR